MKITLINGYAEVPDDSKVIDLSSGKAADIGVISDKSGNLPPLVVVSDKSVRGLSVEEGDKLVDDAIKDLPQYIEAKSQELPYPSNSTSKEEWKRWNDSFRLGFFPLAMFVDMPVSGYAIHEHEHDDLGKGF